MLRPKTVGFSASLGPAQMTGYTFGKVNFHTLDSHRRIESGELPSHLSKLLPLLISALVNFQPLLIIQFKQDQLR